MTFFQLFLTEMTVVCPSGGGPGFFWRSLLTDFFRVPKIVQNCQKISQKVKKKLKKDQYKKSKKYIKLPINRFSGQLVGRMLVLLKDALWKKATQTLHAELKKGG